MFLLSWRRNVLTLPDNHAGRKTRIRDGLLVAAVFFAIAIALSGVLPLWLDEILQLIETRSTTPNQLIHLLPRHPGAAPLGYLLQQAVFGIAGYSVRLARFPSALFAAGAVFLTAVLGADLGTRRPWVPATLFALFPLTLRYACESRTYTPALFFSVLGTVLFVRLASEPDRKTGAAYCLVLAAAVYTQPYAIFVCAAHILWAVINRQIRVAVWTAVAGALAVFSFFPWYAWTRAVWASGIKGAGVHFSYSPRTPLMLFRELTGAGYWGSGLLVILFVAAFRVSGPVKRAAVLLLLLITVPSVLAVGGDSVAGYFVATRQIMWVLPAVAVLAALGMEQRTRVGWAIAALFAALCVWQDIRFFAGPKENWETAATAISAEVGQGACLVVVPAEEVRSYVFFRPELGVTHCPAPRTVVAVTPYATQPQKDAVVSAMTSSGYGRQSSIEAGKSEIDLYSR